MNKKYALYARTPARLAPPAVWTLIDTYSDENELKRDRTALDAKGWETRVDVVE